MNIKTIKSAIIVFFLFCFIFPGKAFAEAGLSEAGRTENYKLNDKYGLDVLPDSDTGGDSISVYEYEENPSINFLNFWFKSKYSTISCSDSKDSSDKSNIICEGFNNPTYIKDTIIWDDESYFNYATGEYFNIYDSNIVPAIDLNQVLIERIEGKYDLDTPFQGPEITFRDILSRMGLTKENSELLDYNYVKSHFEKLDVDNFEGFLDGVMYLCMIPVLCVFVGGVTMVIVAIMVVRSRRRKAKLNKGN